MAFCPHLRSISPLVLFAVIVCAAEAARLRRAKLRRDRPFTQRIPSKYNEEHSQCLTRNTTSNIPPDDGSDAPQNVWAWTVGKARVVANVFAPHWGIVFEVPPPSGVGEETRFVAIQRVLDWDKETKTLHKPCNHAEISIHTSKFKANLIAGNRKMVRVQLVTQVQRDDGGAYKVRDLVQNVAKVMASSPMDLPFSWGSNNCRDFVRRFAMSIGIVKHGSALWGFDEMFNTRDYLDPALRNLCDEQLGGRGGKGGRWGKGGKEGKRGSGGKGGTDRAPCFCRSQTSWIFASWYHGNSCRQSSHCMWDKKSSQCRPKCSDAANQNVVNCENAQRGDCIWSPETQNCTYSQQIEVDKRDDVEGASIRSDVDYDDLEIRSDLDTFDDAWEFKSSVPTPQPTAQLVLHDRQAIPSFMIPTPTRAPTPALAPTATPRRVPTPPAVLNDEVQPGLQSTRSRLPEPDGTEDGIKSAGVFQYTTLDLPLTMIFAAIMGRPFP